jgi:hypothetical protein
LLWRRPQAEEGAKKVMWLYTPKKARIKYSKTLITSEL